MPVPPLRMPLVDIMLAAVCVGCEWLELVASKSGATKAQLLGPILIHDVTESVYRPREACVVEVLASRRIECCLSIVVEGV